MSHFLLGYNDYNYIIYSVFVQNVRIAMKWPILNGKHYNLRCVLLPCYVSGMSVRLNKFLAECGVASRRGAETFIAEGRVQVNGTIATTPAVQIHETDTVTFDGRPVTQKETVRLWRYYKPVGLVCTHHDPEGRPTVFDSLPQKIGRVISVGRLDVASEGLLLLTNNGEMARLLELPSTGLKRTYRVRVFGIPSTDTLQQMRSGVTIEGISYRPAEVDLEEGRMARNCWLRMSIREGKNREIRRMFEHFGHPVNRLIRLSYGEFTLDNLKPGEVKLESDADKRLAALFSTDPGV